MNHKNTIFRLAIKKELPIIWEIIQQAIARRKAEGSQQWQDGYPNELVLENDIQQNAAFVLIFEEKIIGYVAIKKNAEPAYDSIIGEWLSQEDYLVVHRLALEDKAIGKGYADLIFEYIESLALQQNIYSIKADTNYDNLAMLKLFKKRDYQYCGKVYFRGSERLAFEKYLR